MFRAGGVFFFFCHYMSLDKVVLQMLRPEMLMCFNNFSSLTKDSQIRVWTSTGSCCMVGVYKMQEGEALP